jgi:hypothetical protein
LNADDETEEFRMRTVTTILLLSVVLLLAIAGPAIAQSNEDVDRLLNQEQTAFADAAYFVLLAGGHAQETQTPSELFARVDWSEWGLHPEGAEVPITFGELSFLVMQVFDLSGGVMYRILPGPRYAAREIVYRGHTRGTQAASRRVPGDEVLRILSSVLRAAGST